MQRYLLLLLLLCLHGLARGQTEGYSSYYWFDFQQGKPQTSPVVQGSFDVDATALAEGLHAFHYVVTMQDGGISSPITSYFIKTGPDDATIKGYYWFDDEAEVREVMITSGTFEVDASSLSDGFHRFYYQALQANGVTSMPSICYFLKTAQINSDDALTCICTVDNQLYYTEKVSPQGGVIHWNLDMQDLTEGLHQLQIDALKTDGAMSDSQHSFFVKVPESDTTIKGYYWFDEETDARESMVTNGTFEVDASSLSDGFHRFHYYALQANGVTSMPLTNYFLKTAQVNPDDELTCICTVDEKLRHIERLSQEGGVIHWNLDMQDLSDGVHSIQLQAVTPSGALSSSYTSYFMRVTSYEDLNEMYCIYAIDGNSLNSKSQVMSHNGSFHFDLDLSDLEEGLHYISFMLHSDRGASTNAQTQFFVKTPLGGNGITQYQYWLNDDEIKEAVTVTLPEKLNPLQLMSLVPVESRPLRSSQFHFDTSSGKPMIYAKNTIHLRFHDVTKRFTDVAKEYADYSQSQEVKPVGELKKTQTFPTIEENGIRWYTMQSAPGDTAAFKLSQPATIQVFAPSGAEVFKTSESASVKWGGIHTWEDGIYYLAVHDVTGSKEDMTLEYMHMDKYDVVDWDVHRVGNGGCSTITFKGNGFRDLYAVDLIIAPGDTIHSVYISHDSDAETAIAFDFTDAELGEYNAVFHFTEEDKHIANVVTVEEAIDIELATDVSFPSSFLRGTSTTYTIKITNKGNMTAYDVPIYTYIRSKTEEGISYIKFKGLNLASYAEYVVIDDFSDKEKKEILDFSEAISDDWYFTKIRIEDENNPGDSLIIRGNYFFTDIAPNSVKILELTLFTTENGVFVYCTVPPTWMTLSGIPTSESGRLNEKFHVRKEANGYCCVKEGVECFADMINTRLDVTSVVLGAVSLVQPELLPVAGTISWVDCGVSIANTALKAFGDYVCNADEEPTKLKIISMAKKELQSAIGASLSCVSAGLNGIKSVAAGLGGAVTSNIKFGEILKSISSKLFQLTPIGAVLEEIKCTIKLINPNPCCSGGCGGGGGSSTSVTSLDPNDIYGYLSEASSTFIADSVARVNYTIEFENDTMFATAAAHTIVIKDTLDSHYFDLTKFMPTGVRIGGHDVFLNEVDIVTSNDKTTFVKTIDMRPEINAIAQVNGEYNQKNGIAQWTFQSLDPMTMEPTDDLMQGILPVNYDGTSGIGEVMFDIGVKQGKSDGTQIKNRAGIVFDYEEAILTPTWTNIVDAVAPSSYIDNSWMVNDSTLRITADGFDARSGVWKYEWYVQAGENAPWWKEGETESASFDYHIYEGIDYGFCVLAVDSAGNVEQKVIQRERGFKTYGPDYEDNISPVLTSPEVEGPVYDLSGRKHDEPQENQINIIDKKKILFRRKGK